MNNTYYHFDRRYLIQDVLGADWKFANNKGKPNGYFFNLLLSSEAKELFADSFKKVDDFIFYKDSTFDFSRELEIQYKLNENENIAKVIFEFFFENVRRKNYPHLPSRLIALYGVDNLSALNCWKKNYKLLELHMN